MKVALKWLREYVEVALPVEELAHRLSMSGTEVAGLERRGGALSPSKGGSWENVVIGEVVGLARHPNADRLSLATVELGGERLTVVCGAPNVAVGQRVPFAQVGARLIDGHTGQPTVVQAARIRGVVSEGMICSEKELGLSEDHTGIIVLAPDAPIGVPFRDYYGDVILDLDITPNRPDCLSVLGVAREVAALAGKLVREPVVDYPEEGEPIASLVAIEIADPDLCPRYCATLVSGVTIGPAPRWMQERLLAAGMRPINNVVDITNYVMLEYGQPLHAFDFARIGARKVIIRRARPGEVQETLDGVQRALTPSMCVIADAQRPIAIGGVMGGANSEVTESTRTVLLESANFNNVSIRRTAAALKVRSEASLRFEKGLSPELPLPALRRATQLLVELAGGKAAKGIVDCYPGRWESAVGGPILLSTAEVARILGAALAPQQITGTLEGLGCRCEPAAADAGPHAWEVTTPYWRSDLRLTDDLIEEVARIIGYDNLPTASLASSLPAQIHNPVRTLRERLRDLLVGCGLQEVITYSLTSRAHLQRAIPEGQPFFPEPMRVANPMSAEQECLRTSMCPSLLSTLAANLRHQEGLRLFEMGKVFLPREGELPEEREIVAGVMAGRRQERGWHKRAQGPGRNVATEVDFYDAKGVVAGLLARLGLEGAFAPATEPFFVGGRVARVVAQGKPSGLLGQVHPRILERFDIALPVVLYFELELERLLPALSQERRFQPLPRYPGVARDLALVVEATLPAERIARLLRCFALVQEVALFDVYTGPPVPPGKKSLAFDILFQSGERTLTDEDVDQVQGEMVAALQREFGATLRG